MKKFKKEDTHPLAINIQKLQRYNYDYFNCEEVVFFEYIVVKGMAFKKKKEFFLSLLILKLIKMDKMIDPVYRLLFNVKNNG